jgi:PII-like signaling protein
MNKQEFISNYLNEKLKNHGLPYGIQYLNLVAETEEKAEKVWKSIYGNTTKKVYSEKEMKKISDALLNILGCVDTPIGRRILSSEIGIEALKEARIAKEWIDNNLK